MGKQKEHAEKPVAWGVKKSQLDHALIGEKYLSTRLIKMKRHSQEMYFFSEMWSFVWTTLQCFFDRIKIDNWKVIEQPINRQW